MPTVLLKEHYDMECERRGASNAYRSMGLLIRCAANPAVQGRVKSADGKAVLVDWIGFNAASAAVRCTGE